MSATTLKPRIVNQLKFESDWRPSLEEISPYLLSRPKETDTIRLLQELSIAFVDRNELLKTYGEKTDYVSAYAQVFLPTNIPKLEFLIKQLPAEIQSSFESESWQFIDFGCGPGTYSLSWLRQFPKSQCYLIDSANGMLKQAKQLVGGIYGEDRLIYNDQELKKERRILFFGNVINEATERLALDLVKKYRPEFVILIEPGTKASFKQVAKLRESLLKQEYQINYPCLSQEQCPIAPKGEADANDWCHQVLRTSHDLGVERLCQLSRLDRKILPMIGQVYSFKESPVAHNKAEFEVGDRFNGRVVQYLQDNKFAYEYRLCCFIEGQNQFVHCVIPKKKITKEQKKDLKKASVGSQFSMEVIKVDNNKYQVKFSD